jgi:hypothetical protein
MLLATGVARARHIESPRLLSAGRTGADDGGLMWHMSGATPFKLPSRGHGVTNLGKEKALIVGRRPGLSSAIVDTADIMAPPQILSPSRNCRFAGHAAASPDGTLLITGEFDADTVQAVLVARDPKGGKERARWPFHEIEPHELVFTKDGTRIVAALGGLIGDGGVPDPAMNPDGVKSALLEIDPKSGAVLARHVLAPDLTSLSLRHLSVSPDGCTIAVAAQDQDLSESRPLVGVLRLGSGISLFAMPDVREVDFRGYIGSVAFDRSGAFIAAASPRGSVMGVWTVHGKWCGALPITDGCGIAADSEPNMFWVSSGHGGVYKISASETGPKILTQWHVTSGFDHHMILI